MEKQKYMKASDVARRFGVARQTIRNWVKKKLLQAITLDGTQYVTMKSIENIEGQAVDLSVLEEAVKCYKQRLETLEELYKSSIRDLQACCDGNQAIKQNRQTIVKFLPIFYDIIQPDLSVSSRGGKILTMLLGGSDIKTISETFNLTTARIQQIIEAELCRLHKNTQTYQMLKEQKSCLVRTRL